MKVGDVVAFTLKKKEMCGIITQVGKTIVFVDVSPRCRVAVLKSKIEGFV